MIGTCRSAALLLLLASPLQASWVVISEVHYQPAEGESLEFVEIFTRDPPRVDLTGWTLEGDAELTFARGATLLPGESLVIARDPAALRALHPGLERVLGPFSGTLGNEGGRVTLKNAAGVVVSEVRYKNGGKWPAAAGGTGHTLLLRDPLLDPRDPRSWTQSPRPGGSPGAAPEYAMPSRQPGRPVVRKGETWSFFRGVSEPPDGWQALEFDDGSWETGPSGFGYADNDDATELEDMPGAYLTVYTRKSFRVEDPSRLARILLLVSFDDGFIASLNGREVARANLGAPGEYVTHDTPAAATHEAGVAVEHDLGPASSILRPGTNVLAVECHNRSLTSTDLSLIVELESWTPPPSASRGRSGPELLLNEVQRGPEGFVEIHNPTDQDADLAGWFLTDGPADLKRCPIGSGVRAPARGFLALTAKEIGERLEMRGPEAFLALVAPDGHRVVDAVRIAPGESGLSIGRLPDGAPGMVLLDGRTPGAPNRIAARGLVLNEVHYHPLPDDPAAEFIEIHNPGAARVSLEGHRIQGGVKFGFRPGDGVDPGGYLVVAKDPALLAGARGLEPRRVVGPFEGRLGDGGESIRLVDPRGVAVDAVDYADRDPWPRGADGGGSSLERVHPGLDGSFPGAWAASDETSRSAWKAFRYEVEQRGERGASFPDFELILLEAGECLIDDLAVNEGARGRASRTLLNERFDNGAAKWHAEGNHEDSARVPDPDDPDRGCYRLRATGRGNTRHNLAWAPLREAAAPGGSYVVSFSARWLAGSPRLLTRLGGNGLARVHDLVVPPGGGTPGAANSRRDPEAGPVVAAPTQEPVLPSESEPVTFAVRAAALAPIAGVTIEFRRDGKAEWRRAPLADDGKGADAIAGDGLYSGSVPPLPTGIVELFVKVVDANGRTGVYPAGAPGRTALYAVGLRTAPSFPSYTLLVPERTWREMEGRPILSNRLHDATLVIGSSRIFHQVGFRPRGSPFTRKLQNNWKVVFGAETLDGRRSLILDRQDGSARPRERLSYWLMEALLAPHLRVRYVNFRIPGREEGLCEDVEGIDDEFLAGWFGEPGGEEAASQLYKVDDYIEMSDTQGMRVRAPAALVLKGADPEAYRWNFLPRGEVEDFEPLLELIRLFDPGETDDEDFLEDVEGLVDVEEWIRVLAARTVMGDWDTLGRHAGKNASLYRAPSDGRWRLVPWDCDQATQRYPPTDSIYPREQPAFVRFLAQPRFRRMYLGALSYLAEKQLEPGVFLQALTDLRTHAGASVDDVEKFLTVRREYVLAQIPRIELEIRSVERVMVPGSGEVTRVRGTGPVIIQRARLHGREVPCLSLSLEEWQAEFPAGPGSGPAEIELLDLAGGDVARAVVHFTEKEAR